MGFCWFYAHDPETKEAWRFSPSLSWFKKHDNFAAVSCGFTVPSEVTHKQLKALKAISVPYEQAIHGGCQSECITRGGKTCRW